MRASKIDQRHKTVRDRIMHEIALLRQQFSIEDLTRFSSNSSERAKNKRLLHLFQKDLLPSLAAEILENSLTRARRVEDDIAGVHGVLYSQKIVGWSILISIDVGLLLYVFLFAASQDNHYQSAWGQSFIVWLILEIVLVSSCMVILMNICLPSLIKRDVIRIKQKLMESVFQYYETIEREGKEEEEEEEEEEKKENKMIVLKNNYSKKKKKEINKEIKMKSQNNSCKVGDNLQSSLQYNSFNAARYLFLSYRLAERYSDLPLSKIILSFHTPWPRHSFQSDSTVHDHHVKSMYNESWKAISRSFWIIIIFFVNNLLAVPLALQDMIIQMISTVVMGYTILAHIQLYDIFPALIITPSLLVMIGSYYLVQFYQRGEKVEEEKLQERLAIRRRGAIILHDAPVDSDDVVQGTIEDGKSNLFYQEDDNEETRHPIRATTHLTKRESVNQGLIQRQKMQTKLLADDRIRLKKDDNDNHSTSIPSSSSKVSHSTSSDDHWSSVYDGDENSWDSIGTFSDRSFDMV